MNGRINWSNKKITIKDTPTNGIRIPNPIIIKKTIRVVFLFFDFGGAPIFPDGFRFFHIINDVTTIPINPKQVSRPSNWFGQPNNRPSCKAIPDSTSFALVEKSANRTSLKTAPLY